MLATTQESAWNMALANLDAAADALDLSQDIREIIRYPERVLTVFVPVRSSPCGSPPTCSASAV